MERKVGCLVIHGFGGSYREIRPLAEALEEKGVLTKCPRLKGHTGIVSDLKKVCYDDWIASAEAELVCLKAECEEVFIAGFSMGGLIGVQLALKYEVQGLVTINTPIYYLDFSKIVSNIISDLRSREFINIKRYLKPSNRLPVKALLNFRQLLNATKSRVPEVKTPLMIAQAIDDDVVQHRSAGYLYTRAGSACKQLCTYTRGGHVLLLSETKDALITDIFRFIDQQLPVALKKAG